MDRIKQCPSLPSLPAIAVQVLELAQSHSVDIPEIARIISKDPALSTKILRTVNSSFYGLSHAISTINHAMVVLGLQSVKTLVLTFSLTSSLAKNSGKGFQHLNFWRRSIYAATAAKVIAAKVRLVQQEEAFLASLLSDIGMLVFERVLAEEYNELCAKVTTHPELLAAETAALGITHAGIGGFLAAQWKLPPVLSEPIAYSHNVAGVKDPALKKLTEVVELAGFCSDVFLSQDAEKTAPAIAYVRQAFTKQLAISPEDCDAMLNEIAKLTKEAASLFEINIGSHATYESILEKSRDLLAELSLENNQETKQLKAQNKELQQIAATDGLTGLANRAKFDAFLAEQFKMVAEGMPVSLLMLDLDKFKSVNDTHGHQAGDAVLAATAQELRKAARRSQDLAARYGGEEMIVLLAGTPRATAEVIAEGIRRAIGAKRIKCGNNYISVTVSIGVATAEPGGPLKSPEMLLKAADMAVYAAKRGGRNCIKVFTLKAA